MKGNMPEKTQTEIEAEIAALEACKKYAPHYSRFGDNNHRNIDIQIEYLRGDIDTTAEEFNEDYDTDAQSLILEAEDWKLGRSKESPSSGWDNYKPKG